jgi:hypothetical protein
MFVPTPQPGVGTGHDRFAKYDCGKVLLGKSSNPVGRVYTPGALGFKFTGCEP